MTSPVMLASNLRCHSESFAHMSDRNTWPAPEKATVEKWKEPLKVFAPARQKTEYLKNKKTE